MNQQTSPLASSRSRFTRKRAQLVFHSESNPFGATTAHEAEAKALFEQVRAKDSARFSQFVGFLCSKHTTYICLPKIFRAYLIDAKSNDTSLHHDHLLRPLPLLLRRCLKRYKDTQPKQEAVHLLNSYVPNKRHPQNAKPVSHLSLAQELLDDFKHHGLWLDTTQTIKRGGRGRVKWSRTIQRGGELLAEQGEGYAPIYPRPLTQQRQQRADHSLTLTQLAVLYEIDALYGALLTERPLVLPTLLGGISAQPLAQLARQLKRAQTTLFQDRPKRLAKLLLSYLELNDTGHRDQVDLFGTTSFELIFEHMCATVFQSDLSLVPKAALGQVQWRLNKKLEQKIGSIKRTGRAQQPDLLIKAHPQGSINSAGYQQVIINSDQPKPSLLIFDAKYYDIIGALTHYKSGAAHLPGLEDIRKQYAYAYWIQQLVPQGQFERLYNALLFPIISLDEFSELTEPFAHLGEVSLSTSQAEVSSHTEQKNLLEEPIWLLGVDLALLMSCFVAHKSIETLILYKGK